VVTEKKNTFTQFVLEHTPFYAESGGQQGDKGWLEVEGIILEVADTKKENDISIHIVNGMPALTSNAVEAKVDSQNRTLSCKNHSATHLLHAALKQVLGKQVQQKGSSLNAQYLRFDFNHFAKMSDEELKQVEQIVNNKIFESIALDEKRSVAKEEALKMGANALFGEKYGDTVRVITFDPEFSVELCGGTHVSKTSEIGLFKITQETAVAAGVRRIEAITAHKALAYLNEQTETLSSVKTLLNYPQDTIQAVESVLTEVSKMKKQIEHFEQAQWQIVKSGLKSKIVSKGKVNLLIESVQEVSAEGIKKIAYDLKNENDNLIAMLTSSANEKVQLCLMIDEDLVKEYNLNAGQLIKTIAKHVQGGGGGQPFFATAGGSLLAGIPNALAEATAYFEKVIG
jgi:alanyl-tRNA synthetase